MNSIKSDRPRVVLVVEDEPLVRMCAVEIVELAGLKAIEAADAHQALGLLDQGNKIDILFTDVEMPGSIDGLELVRRVRVEKPDVGVIVASGRRFPSSLELKNPARFFSKPYDEARITLALREVAGCE